MTKADSRAVKIVELQEELAEAKRIIGEFVWQGDSTPEQRQEFVQRKAIVRRFNLWLCRKVGHSFSDISVLIFKIKTDERNNDMGATLKCRRRSFPMTPTRDGGRD